MGRHDFYAEYLGRIYKVCSDIHADNTQYAASNMMATCTDIFTGDQVEVRVLALEPLNDMEVLARASTLDLDEHSGPGPLRAVTRDQLRPLHPRGEGEADEAQG